MSVKIGSNVASLQAQRRLSEASSSLSKTFERLSSGQRINRAADDAAGLAISETLKVKNRVYGQAVRNVNDGISLFSITEGAIGELKGILMRQRELATQAANGSYTLSQRQALDKESKSLQDEYNRVIKSTAFNGRKVFDESQGALILQAGYGESGALQAVADNTFDFAPLPIRITTDSNGGQANSISLNATFSAEAGYVVFESFATNLVNGDTNGMGDIFLKNVATGEVKRVNTSSSGSQAEFRASELPQVTPDGRYVIFNTNATNLVSGDANGLAQDVFLKDVQTGEIRMLSTSSSGEQGNGTSQYAQISADGRYVVFESNASNLANGDTNGQNDIFLKDVLTGETRLVSTNSFGTQSSGASTDAQISADGRYVLFSSDATNLVAGDTNGQTDIFLKDLLTGQTTRVNTDSAGNQALGGLSEAAQISRDGRYVSFQTTATNLVAGGDANGNTYDVILKDLWTNETKYINTAGTGAQAVGGLSAGVQLSSDSRYAVFTSNATNLVSNDTNGANDVFVKDLLTGETRRLSVDASGGQLPSGGGSAQITRDGRYVMFSSAATTIVSGDTNGVNDYFVVANSLAERFSLNLLDGVSLQTTSGASYMQDYLDRQLNNLNIYQGQLGAIQTRLDLASNVLSAMRENFSAAAGRITDADVAEESSTLMRTQILQQSSSAILAQANQQPTIALSLLQAA